MRADRTREEGAHAQRRFGCALIRREGFAHSTHPAGPPCIGCDRCKVFLHQGLFTDLEVVLVFWMVVGCGLVAGAVFYGRRAWRSSQVPLTLLLQHSLVGEVANTLVNL